MERIIFCAFLCFLALGITAGVEPCTQYRDGCRLHEGQCECGRGCYTEYRYSTRGECMKSRRAASICSSGPCKHGGVCSQSNEDPGFKCRCEGTGFHGQRCHKACPKWTTRLTGEFPYECIVI